MHSPTFQGCHVGAGRDLVGANSAGGMAFSFRETLITMRTGIATFALMCWIFLGCAPRHECHNCRYGAGLIAEYDRKNCQDLPGGKFTCKNVVFNPTSIHAK